MAPVWWKLIKIVLLLFALFTTVSSSLLSNYFSSLRLLFIASLCFSTFFVSIKREMVKCIDFLPVWKAAIGLNCLNHI